MADCDSVVGLTLEEHWGVESFDHETDGTVSIQVFDLTGRCVGNSLEHLAPGVYVIRRYDGTAVTTKKTVIR